MDTTETFTERCTWCSMDYNFFKQSIHCPHSLKPSRDEPLTVESVLVELRAMFPMSISASWRDFEIRARVYTGEWKPFEIVHFDVDGCGRRWEGDTLTDCMAQVRKWKKEQAK